MPPKKSKKGFSPKELVLAKMHGFPAWPSFVMPHELIPESILQVKKKSTEFCVIFIPDGDFYWMNEKSLELLTEEKLDKKLEKIPNKSKKPKPPKSGKTTVINDALLATKGLEFEQFMKQLKSENNDLEDDEDEDEEEEEEEADDGEEVDEDAPEVKDELENKQDSEEESVSGKEEEEESKDDAEDKLEKVKEEEDEDEGEEEEEEEGDPENEDNSILDETISNSRSKRKQITASNGNNKRNKPSTPPNGSKDRKKSENSPKVLTEEEKQHQLWLCRIKLQRSLIQKNQPVKPANKEKLPRPTADELLIARLILHRLADFPVTIELLKTTKIHKVLKCILKDNELEYPDSFELHQKCIELLNKWNDLIEAIKLEKLNKILNKPNGLKDAKYPAEESEISAIESSIKDKESESIKNGELKYASVES